MKKLVLQIAVVHAAEDVASNELRYDKNGSIDTYDAAIYGHKGAV